MARKRALLAAAGMVTLLAICGVLVASGNPLCTPSLPLDRLVARWNLPTPARRGFDEYARQTKAALAFVRPRRHELPEVRASLEAFERGGPRAELPPAPDPQALMGWNDD